MNNPDPIREERGSEAQGRLDVANANFEEFISMAAHNMREPLREVASLSQLIAEDHGGALTEEARALLVRVRQAAGRMESLLTGVVDYWSEAPRDPPASQTGLESVLYQALLSLEKQIAERAAVVTHDPLPEVTGDFALLTKILRHLIRNAIQYCDAVPPLVHISSRREAGEWIISVRDNGSGIDSVFVNRLFKPFRRLHGPEYPGIGLGLAFCRKALEHQGARMWVQSTPGTGSTFYFSLPPANAEQATVASGSEEANS